MNLTKSNSRARYPFHFAQLTCCLLLCASQARSAVVIFDNFSRGTPETPVVLNGSSPSTYTGPGSVSWVTNSATVVTDGTEAILTNRSFYGVFNYALTAGFIYELLATIDVTDAVGNDLNFIGISLFQTASSNLLSGMDKNGIALRYNGSVNATFNGVSTATLAPVGTYLGATTLKVTLDTSNPQWTIAYQVGDTVVNRTFTDGNPIINGFGFGSGGGASSTVWGVIDNFTFSATAVPEPSTMALVAATFMGLIAFRVRAGKRTRGNQLS